MDAHCIGFHRNTNNCNLIHALCITYTVYNVASVNTIQYIVLIINALIEEGMALFLLKYCIYCVSSPSLHRELVTHKVKESQTKICDILLPGCCFDAVKVPQLML